MFAANHILLTVTIKLGKVNPPFIHTGGIRNKAGSKSEKQKTTLSPSFTAAGLFFIATLAHGFPMSCRLRARVPTTEPSTQRHFVSRKQYARFVLKIAGAPAACRLPRVYARRH